MQSASSVRELDPEHTSSQGLSHAAIGFHGSPLSKLCSHLRALRCVPQGLQGKPAWQGACRQSPGLGAQTRYPTVFTSCRFEYSVRPKLAFFKQEKFMIKPCKILKHQYEHVCGGFFF